MMGLNKAIMQPLDIKRIKKLKRVFDNSISDDSMYEYEVTVERLDPVPLNELPFGATQEPRRKKVTFTLWLDKGE